MVGFTISKNHRHNSNVYEIIEHNNFSYLHLKYNLTKIQPKGRVNMFIMQLYVSLYISCCIC